MLNWANQFNIFCLLDSNNEQHIGNNYDILLAVDSIQQFASNQNALQNLEKINNYGDWLFGNINFELYNQIEKVNCYANHNFSFELVHFFCPRIVIFIKNNTATIQTTDGCNEKIWQAINDASESVTPSQNKVHIKHGVTPTQYYNKVNAIKKHIQNGDCYEINYCIPFYANDANINPIDSYIKLKKISPTPFHSFYKYNNQYLLCASPERYIQRQNNTIISQPIKGTIKRDKQNKANDVQLIKTLQNDPKEISENVMVVDLVRNDLSKICVPNTVLVQELLKVYSFSQVHHLITTIKGQLQPNITIAQIIEATFPMGSMTGAPKKRVLELIHQYETTARGIFSGTVGYIAPNGNFDFNVVIRSIIYNDTTKYLQYYVGSGITTYCDAQKEYEECLLKAKAMEAVL
jgi:para-aminobenzoate synthetase component 1